jgi:hypothetical protein
MAKLTGTIFLQSFVVNMPENKSTHYLYLPLDKFVQNLKFILMQTPILLEIFNFIV